MDDLKFSFPGPGFWRSPIIESNAFGLATFSEIASLRRLHMTVTHGHDVLTVCHHCGYRSTVPKFRRYQTVCFRQSSSLWYCGSVPGDSLAKWSWPVMRPMIG
eukprot:402674-Hanusia_phi.AAC.2